MFAINVKKNSGKKIRKKTKGAKESNDLKNRYPAMEKENRALRNKFKDLKDENKALKRYKNKYNNLKKRYNDLKDEMKTVKKNEIKLESESKVMKIKLCFYESSNMPSSAPNLTKENRMRKKATEMKRNLKKQTQPGKKPRKKPRPGGVKGHKGNTKVLGEPDEIIECDISSCPKCKSENVKMIEGKKKKKVEESIVITVIKQFNMQKCECEECGEEFYSRHEECPPKGNIGINNQARLAVNRFMGHGSLGVCGILAKTNYKLETTRQTVNTVINRIVPAIKPEYEKIVERTKNAFLRNADETGHNLNGGKMWLWVSVAKDAVLYLFGDRSGNTAEELLGTANNDLKILGVDGWSAYKRLGFRIQRCWDHLKRKAEANDPKDKDAIKFEKAIIRFYMDIKDYKLNFPDDENERAKMHDQCMDRFHAIIAEFEGIEIVKKQLKHFENGGRDWFTCILFREVDMSNNLAERYIRDPVLDRKISYCFRNEENMRNYAILKSVIMTWRKNGFNVFEKLIEALKTYNANGIA